VVYEGVFFVPFRFPFSFRPFLFPVSRDIIVLLHSTSLLFISSLFLRHVIFLDTHLLFFSTSMYSSITQSSPTPSSFSISTHRLHTPVPGAEPSI
jgi:hypothetical protein